MELNNTAGTALPSGFQDDEVRAIGESSERTEVPLVPKSKLSETFHQYLISVEQYLPNTFPKALLDNMKKLKSSKKQEKLQASHDIAINAADLEIAWDEAATLCFTKYNLTQPIEWMSRYFYLLILILDAKLKCLMASREEVFKDFLSPSIPKLWENAERLIRFHRNIFEEEMHLHHKFYLNSI